MAGGMKRLAKETAVYGLSSIVGRFLNWMLVPMYTRVLAGTGDYGIVTNLYGWTALLLVLLTYGMETGFFRFINKKEEQEPMRVYASVLYCLLGSSALFSVAVFTLLPSISAGLGYGNHPEYIGMMAGIVAVDAFCCIPFAYLRYKGKAWRFAGIKLLSIFLNIILNIFFLITCPWLHTHYPEAISWFYRPDYGVGYVFVANVFTTLITLLLLIPDILPGIRAKVDGTVLMVMFTQAFRYAYEPFIFAKNKSDDNKKAYSEAMKYFIIFALFIFLGVMFYIDILKYFVGPAYYPGLRVVPIVMLGELFFVIYFNLSLWYKLIDQTRWGAYFSTIGCVATVSIILLFGPSYGYMACAWASFFCNLLMMLLSYFVGQKKFPIEYDLKSAFLYFGVATVLYVAGMALPIQSEWLRLGYRTILLGVFIAFMVKRDLPLRELPYVGRFFR